MNVVGLSLLGGDADKDDSLSAGLDIARRMSSVIHAGEDKAGGIPGSTDDEFVCGGFPDPPPLFGTICRAASVGSNLHRFAEVLLC